MREGVGECRGTHGGECQLAEEICPDVHKRSASEPKMTA